MKFDLHIHSCLSPCASLEMAPSEIVARAAAAGMSGIALTDHNSSRNCPAIAECARRAGIGCLYGLEVCTAEEVHVLTLFDTTEQASAMTDWVYAAMIKRVNDPEAFGDQPVVTWDNDIVELEWRILGSAARKTVQETGAKCRELGGLFVAAHVDRPAFSVFSQLGGIPPDAGFDAIEISRTGGEDEWRAKTEGFAATRSSDAHNLDDVALVWTEIPDAPFTVASLRAAFAARATAVSPPLRFGAAR